MKEKLNLAQSFREINTVFSNSASFISFHMKYGEDLQNEELTDEGNDREGVRMLESKLLSQSLQRKVRN